MATSIVSYTFEAYLNLVKSFHGYAAPGVLIGGFMVDLAYRHLPKEGLFDGISETRHCLPDAIQLLTPCTVGNGWLKVLNLGRYALTLYEKSSGKGIRVYLDPAKLENWPEIKAWFFKLKLKSEQDSEILIEQIRAAATEIFGIQEVEVASRFIKTDHRDHFGICPLCRESYPIEDGGVCRACQGETPYLEAEAKELLEERESLVLKTVPVEQAVGLTVLHDMTEIIPGKEKGPAFKRGDCICAGDICRLHKMGKESIYVAEENPDESRWVHEDDAALAFAKAMAGQGVSFTEKPSEGKANLIADRDGLFLVDEKRLEMFNMIPGVMCASRKSFSMVEHDFKVAGTRAIPLFLPRSDFLKAMSVLQTGPLFRIVPFQKAKIGILVTGTEVFKGLVEDKFIPIVRHKVERFGSEVVSETIVPDDRGAIRNGIQRLLDAGAEIIITTAGLSVDPDDVTRQGLLDAGVSDMLYGAPILPGAMTLVARIGSAQLIGIPACALFHKITAFDVLFPRLLAGLTVTRQGLARLGDGGLCLECKACTFPKCPFCH